MKTRRDYLAEAEEASRHCALECDGPGHLNARVAAASATGRALVVARSYSTTIRATELGAPAVTNLETAAAAAKGWTAGPCVVSDRAFKFMAVLAPGPMELVVFEGVETLWLPNCPALEAATVWVTRFTSRRIPHRGWASECYSAAVRNDAVVRRRAGRLRPSLSAPVSRDLYYDVCDSESRATREAVRAGDRELALASFPGSYERLRRGEGEGTGDCPVCYEPPAPRVTTICCGRDFCLDCAARCMGDETQCPWCRRPSGLWNCSLEHGHSQAPFKDNLVADIVRAALQSSHGARVLVVTTDDAYTYRTPSGNPLMIHGPAMVAGSAASIEASLARFSGECRVAIAHADRMFCCGLEFPATHVVFTERDASRGDLFAFWVGACPGATSVRCMSAITDAARAY